MSIEGLLSVLRLKDPYVIAGSGASVWQAAKNDEKIHISFSIDEVRECARFAARYGYGCLAVSHDGSFYHAPGSLGVEFYVDLFKTPNYPVDFEKEEITDCCKAMVFTELEPGEIELCLERLGKEMSEYSYGKSWTNIVEVSLKGVSKESAMARLADMLSMPLSEVIAIGDEKLDMGMARIAGLGVAMGNGDAEFKAAADYVTLSNDEDGVAHVIEKFILNV